MDINDNEILFNSSISPTNNTGIYIEERQLNDFFEFQHMAAINVMHINCRSMKKNFNDIVNLISTLSGSLTAIALTETWLTTLNEDTYKLPGYKFISQTRINKTGGGVGIFICNDFLYKTRSDLCRMTCNIECLFVEITQREKPSVLIGCIYRPPNTDVVAFNSEFESILKIIDSNHTRISILAGDYNLDLIKHDKHGPTAEFLNNLLAYSYIPTIRSPTRIANTSATLIDNIFINSVQYRMKTAIVYSDISDHLPIALHLETNLVKNIRPNSIVKRAYDENSVKCFNADLASFNNNWNAVYDHCITGKDANAAFECFADQYRTAFEKNFPQKVVKNSYKLTPRQEWMTKGLIKSCFKKSALYKKYKKTSKKVDKDEYLAYNKKLRKLLKVTEKTYYYNKFKSLAGDLRNTWKLLNNLTGKVQRENIVNSFIVDGVIITNNAEIVEKLNDYFVEVGSRLAASVPPAMTHFSDYLKKSYVNSLVLYPTDAAEIVNIVSCLKNKNSSGVDDIPITILKSSIFYIAEPLAAIVNCSLNTGNFPNALKIARVTPIFKGGEKDCFQNYRPISVLPSFSKIFEKVVFNRLIAYFDSSKVICSNQYGFRKNHSTYMSLIDIYDKISMAADKSEFSIGIFIDLSKAFDTLNHNILLQKLEHYGIRGISLDWFKSYLSNRKQCVILNGVTSSLKSITHGVPQGSILGPLLFILYINDIVNCSDLLLFILFADDTNLFFSGNDIWKLKEIVNSELINVSNWFRANKLSLNTKKTKFILFGNKQIPDLVNKFSVSIDGYLLEQVQHTKFLGVFIDAKLNWKTHIEYIAMKISKGLGALGRVRNILPQNAMLMLYNTMVSPYLTYCNIVWGTANASALQRLVVLQNRAVRLVTRSKFRSSCNPLFVRLRILKLVDINKYQIALFMFKIKYHLLPLTCMRYITVMNTQRSYATRLSSYFNIVGYRTVMRENSVSVQGPKVWNSLPKSMQNVYSVAIFKRELITFFINAYKDALWMSITG